MSKTRRRRFLLSAGALLVAPFAAEAQQAGKVWRVGVIRPGPDDAVFRQNFDPFRHALREFRFTEGTNLTIEYRVRAGKPEEILALANDLVRAKVDAKVRSRGISPSSGLRVSNRLSI